MIDCAMILAAGRGERMRPLTDILPKPLLPLKGKPLMQYHLEKLAAAGIRKVIVNHAWLGEKIEAAFGNGEAFNLQIIYSAESEALETAGGIVKALPHFAGNPFMVVNGDVYCDIDFTQLCREPLRGLARLVLVDNPEHHPEGDFAVSDGRVAQKCAEQSYTFSGIALYNPEFFAGLKVERMPLAPLIRRHMQNGRVEAELFHGRWCDVGTPERLANLEQELSL
ncbi:N-acetylmuramate alpha-1-phosphate uridylyltransferase MurU [Planctobacterium marinum]|uniref:Mannose-1-phosphate guanylyltransferase n=1 Tax=Planctobacterium marinum TaxID=1631968 RepID=A0AA48KRH2_9ALTE|nr:mannose-1-phosphate guanylyltransferase [Planctobacterium marinum]